MYDRDATETSKGALVELCRALRQYKNLLHDYLLLDIEIRGTS
jgi:Leu/Phe-tRNA-protein transferase